MACFAYEQNMRGKWGCKAITSECDGRDESCPFYKSIEQHMADKEAANRRIAELPMEQQQAIADKHYNGEKLWLKYT